MSALIEQNEIDELPSEPIDRFIGLERICHERLNRHIWEQNVDDDWIKSKKIEYMAVVISAAEHLEIEPLNRFEIPTSRSWSYNDYEDFIVAVRSTTTRLALKSSDVRSGNFIRLQGQTRDRIKTLLSHLRDHVAKLELPPHRIDSLVQRIDHLEIELNKPRLSFIEVATFTLFFAGAIADLDASAQVVWGVLNKIEAAVGSAKIEQEMAASFDQLSSPQKKIGFSSTDVSSNASATLDDDIPFGAVPDVQLRE